jgi:hypothetical protein
MKQLRLVFLLFPEKGAKNAVVKTVSYPKLGEADPGVWGLPSFSRCLLFPEKEAKSVSSANPRNTIV